MDNTLLYLPNDVVDAGFDGWPTFIAAACSLVAFVVTAVSHPEGVEGRPPANSVGEGIVMLTQSWTTDLRGGAGRPSTNSTR